MMLDEPIKTIIVRMTEEMKVTDFMDLIVLMTHFILMMILKFENTALCLSDKPGLEGFAKRGLF
jgi:hypothetical protein